MFATKIKTFAITSLAAAGLTAAAFLGAGPAAAFIGNEDAEGPAGPITSADQGFLDDIDALGITYESTEGLISDAHVVCNLLDDGERPDDILASFREANPSLSKKGAEGFIVASVTAYCPEYLG